MNRAEAAKLLSFVSAYDRRTIGEADALAWADALHDVDYSDAAQAVREHFRESRDWLMPADVRKRVKATREERLARTPVDAPAGELTDDARRYMASLNRNVRAIADGKNLDRVLERAEPVDNPHYRQVRADRDEARIGSLTVHCPWCHASAGDPCVSHATGSPLTRTSAHHARLILAGLAEPETDAEHAYLPKEGTHG